MGSARRSHRKKLPTVLASLAIAAAVDGALRQAHGSTASVAVTNTSVGVTPQLLGYNMGHYMSGSNTSAWLKYSNANAFRYWASSGDYEPTDDMAPYGDGVTTQSQFDSRKGALRLNPESTTYINWPYFKDKFANTIQSGRNTATFDYPFTELQKMGIDVVQQTTRGSGGIDTWSDKWEQWQYYYAMAYYSAKNYDTQRFQMYNEPDLSGGIEEAEWLVRLHVASDAIQSAVADVNTLYGKKLKADLYAPVAASTVNHFPTWGADALNSNRTDMNGNPTTTDVFNTYDIHRYNSLGSTFASDQNFFNSNIPVQNASGQMMPVTYTEWNRYNSSTFAGRSDNLDTASVYTELAGIPLGAMQGGNVKGMYAFKFSQVLWEVPATGNTEPMKTGFYYVDNDNDPYNITGVTQGAEVLRLVFKAFKDGRDRLSSNVSASNGNYENAVTLDPGHGNYYYYSINHNQTASYDTTIDLSGWSNVQPGTQIAIEEVSDQHHGGMVQMVTVPANKIVSVSQPLQSVWLLTIPTGTAQTLVNLSATADAQVSHASPTSNFGSATTANIDRSDSTSTDDAAYLKFNLGANAKAKVARAYLNVTGQNIGDSSYAPIHVYGILNDGWTEGGINWNNAPDLAGAADAKLANVGSDAFPVGQLTWNTTLHEWGIDVTDFIRTHPDADLSFVLIREKRNSTDADASKVSIAMRNAASGAPRLSLFLSQKPTWYWAKNNAQDVNNLATNPNFSANGNWDVTGSTPGVAGDVAVLGDYITTPRGINVNSNITLGEMRFDNLNGYTLTGSQTITFDGGSGAASSINVHKGSHTIDAPLALTTAMTANVESRGALNMTKAIAGTVALTKTGGGTLTLGGANTFGPAAGAGLLINAGAVNVNGTYSKPVTVASGGTLGGKGTLAGAVTADGKVAPGGIGVASATPLTLNGTLTLNAGSSIDFDFAPGVADSIAGSGALTLSGGAGTTTINLNDLGGLTSGDYNLIRHSNVLSSIAALAIGSHPAEGTYSLLNNSGFVVLHVTGITGSFFWSGAQSGVWDVNTTANFNGSADGKYTDGNPVNFTDSAVGPTTITIAPGGVQPASVTFSTTGAINGGKDYVVGGPGAISGSTTLTVNGVGSVTLTSTNTYTGATTLNAGTLNLATASAVGSTSSIILHGGALAFSNDTTLTRPLTFTSNGQIDTAGYNVTYTGAIAGAAKFIKTGGGSLTMTTAAGAFTGTTSVRGGILRLTHSGAVGGGAVSVESGGTFELDNVTMTTNDITLAEGGAFAAGGGASNYTKSNNPNIDNAAANVTLMAVGANDSLTIGSAIRNTNTGSSTATITVAGLGLVALRSGGISSPQTFSGSWNMTSGTLQLGPTIPASSESLNALGFKNGDAQQANPITVMGGTLLGAINQPFANHTTTPSFFRSGVTLAGGAIGSTGLNSNWGGDFIVQDGTTSQVLVYDPMVASTPRDVNLVAGAAGTLNAVSNINWAGTVVVTPGPLAVGGAMNINRTGGAVSVGPNAVLQIDPGATVNLGGVANSLYDGTRGVLLKNDGVFNLTNGAKDAGAVTGSGVTTVAAGTTLSADAVRQNSLVANGIVHLRPSVLGTFTGTSKVLDLTIAPGTGSLDLANNSLIVSDPIGPITALIATGRNGGAWNGLSGITTSTPNGSLTSLGVSTASQVLGISAAATATWSGQIVSGSDTLVMYTYGGDATLDGKINIDDYVKIDAGIASGLSGWSNGDFNYDNKISIDDYLIIDGNIPNQQGQFPSASGGGPASDFGELSRAAGPLVTAIPEPATTISLLIPFLMMSPRRRRR